MFRGGWGEAQNWPLGEKILKLGGMNQMIQKYLNMRPNIIFNQKLDFEFEYIHLKNHSMPTWTLKICNGFGEKSKTRQT